MPLPAIAGTNEPIASTVPTQDQRVQISGTRLQIGGQEIQGFFASLQEDPSLALLGQQNQQYNCIAWSVGQTNNWINPPQQNPNANDFYRGRGFTACTSGDTNKRIAVWFDANGNCTHAAVRKRVSINGQTVLCWTSKLGQSYCIAHSLDRLNGGGYGTPALYFK